MIRDVLMPLAVLAALAAYVYATSGGDRQLDPNRVRIPLCGTDEDIANRNSPNPHFFTSESGTQFCRDY